MNNLTIKKLITISMVLLIVSCSEKSMQKLGLRKEQPDAYLVSRKDPLTMPPDMTLRPPNEEKIKYDQSSYSSGKIKNSQSSSIDDILLGNGSKEKSKVKRKKNSIDLISKILRTKADAVLR